VKSKKSNITASLKQGYKRKASPVKHTVKSKRSKLTNHDDCHIIGVENDFQMTVWPDLRFYPVDEIWQCKACERLRLQFRIIFHHQPGGPDTILTCPDKGSLHNVRGDGNCLF